MRVPGPGLITRAVAGPMPFAPRRSPLTDPTPDAGLFGPGSVTWRVMREPFLIMAAGRALLMQAANPLVAQGAIDHSNFNTDPYGRFERTVLWVTLVSFGTTSEARKVTRDVNRLHRRVTGTVPEVHATRQHPAGTEYSAAAQPLLRWVHASFVDTMLVAHDALVGGLSEHDRDCFVREWDSVAALMKLREGSTWRTAAALRAYVRRELTRGGAVPGEGSRHVAETVLHPPVASPWMQPGMELLSFISSGLLPAELRDAYGVSWTPAHAAAHAAALLAMRSARRALPRRGRISPVYDRAMSRIEGRWPAASAA
ncbi:MAG: DUF2236 domain-containing protein [Candidatus Dormibacteraeota bacterium]|nr:DUF2236 domain-containing protein [Candidatus Dormibacteraeota bacterium]MBV8445668.1 DUF2236 domain-containing protein [Candidatus Dormibacteraeota bacterium]